MPNATLPPPGESGPELLVPRLDLSSGPPDPQAIATWHMAISNLVGPDIPHQLLALWVFPEEGGTVLLGPEELGEHRLAPAPRDRQLGQDQLLELEDTVRRAKYASAVAIPIRGATRDVGVAVLGAFEGAAYGPERVRRLQRLGRALAATLDPLSRMIRGRPSGEDSAITPLVPADDLPAAVTAVMVEAASGPELVRQLSGLLHAHLPHDRLEVLAFANGTGAALPLSGTSSRRRWGAGGQTWGDLVRLIDDVRGTARVAAIADLPAEAPGLGWPGSGAAPVRITSVLGASLEVAGQAVGMVVLGHVARDLYRAPDEALAESLARLVAARVAGIRLDAEVHALRGQLEVLQAPSLPVLRAAEALAATAHLGEALHRVNGEIAELLPHRAVRYHLRWSDAEVVTLSADAIRPLPDLPLTALADVPARSIIEGEQPWLAVPLPEGVELAVPLEVAGRRLGAMVVEAASIGSPRDAAALLHQFAAIVAPHLELIRRGAIGPAVRPTRGAAAEPAPRSGG